MPPIIRHGGPSSRPRELEPRGERSARSGEPIMACPSTPTPWPQGSFETTGRMRILWCARDTSPGMDTWPPPIRPTAAIV